MFAYAFAAMNGFSQSQMMDLIQNRRLDPGTAVKAITNKSQKYIKECFYNYGMPIDKTGSYSATWRPFHYIGMELAQSIYAMQTRTSFCTNVFVVGRLQMFGAQKFGFSGCICSV